MAQLAERLDSVVFTERCAPGLKERLRRQHQDFQWSFGWHLSEAFDYI
jgi:hypothetical protein